MVGEVVLFRMRSPHATMAPAIVTRAEPPRYPLDLRDKGIPGRAALGFVVNAAGRVERQTMRIVDANFLAFAEAVTQVLPRYRFAPATIDGCSVPQQVLMPFGFNIR